MGLSLSFLGNNSVKTFQLQVRIVEVVFYAARVLSKERSRLVLHRASYFCFGGWVRLSLLVHRP
jgi:hypothetical protein